MSVHWPGSLNWMERSLVTTSGLNFEVICVCTAWSYEWAPPQFIVITSNYKICCVVKTLIKLKVLNPRVCLHSYLQSHLRVFKPKANLISSNDQVEITCSLILKILLLSHTHSLSLSVCLSFCLSPSCCSFFIGHVQRKIKVFLFPVRTSFYPIGSNTV